MRLSRAFVVAMLLLTVLNAAAQGYNQLTDTGQMTTGSDRQSSRDSLSSKNKEIPRGLKVWNIDERFGDRTETLPDTMPHMYMNSIFDTGIHGEYSTLGNIGSPRLSRIFVDRTGDGDDGQFIFTRPYDYFITPVSRFAFTNTLSPITNISYNTCGNRTNGEDHFKALFGVNAGKRIGAGFKFDYIYGRGYFQNQSTAHFNYTMYASYMGDRYNAHLLLSTNHQKVTENGGITDDQYITHPETFSDNFRDNEIPTVLQQNWNRNDNLHLFLSHRYNVGFSRKVKMTPEEIEAKRFALASQKENAEKKAREEARKKAEEEGRDFDEEAFNQKKTFAGRPDGAAIAGNEPRQAKGGNSQGRISVDKAMADSLNAATNYSLAAAAADTSWLKDEYVPVTSFIHTMKFDNYTRIYQAYDTPENYYADTFPVSERFSGDSIYDRTTHYSLKNTFAIALLEGFNKWAKAGLRAFVTSDLRHFTLPDSTGGRNSYNEHNLSIGAQLVKAQGRALHYTVTAETWLLGEDAGSLRIDADADLNFRFLGDTVTLAARAFMHRVNPSFYFRHYHSKHFWWDNSSLSKETRSRLEGVLNLRRTRTKLRVAYDNLQNYTYLAQSYTVTEDYSRAGNTVAVRQASGNISVLTLQLMQDFKLGPLHWDNVVTYQKTTDESALPLPQLNVYSNLYFHFKLARVLTVDLGGDVRFFTSYTAPDYSPALGQFAVQDNGEANVEVGNYPIVNVYANMHLKRTRFFVMMSHVNAGSGDRFLVPHYPVNGRIFRFGVSWNFFN